MGSSRLSDASQDRRSLVDRTMDKAKSKVSQRSSNAERLSSEKDDLGKEKAKNFARYNKKADYERLNLREQTIFGMNGAGGGLRSG